MSRVIGIDLGTTNSVAAVFESKSPTVIITQDGDRILPSVVAFNQKEERLVGNPAKSQQITNPENTIYSVKRLMGKRFSEIEPFLDQFSYELTKGPDDCIKIKIKKKLFSPEEISAMLLEKLKESAEKYLGAKIQNAVITVPAYFDDSQRQATKDAGEIAGLNVTRIINEPTAAALAFSLEMKGKSKVLVYDFGGGTIDISLLEVDKEIIKVLATAGDSNLGGNDLDMLLANLLIEEFKEEYALDLSNNKLAVQRIRDASEIAKKELSSLDACEINLPFMADSEDGPLHLVRYISRNEFENLIMKKVDTTIGIMKELLGNSRIDLKEVSEILLVGGSTRIPLVQRKVREFFNKDPNKKINPDEIVALGAAIQGAIAQGDSRDMLLLDVIPLSLGVKTYGGSFTRIVDANTTIPIDRSLVFSTVEDNQNEVEINVYQGENKVAEENKLLGQFSFRGINPAPKGIPRIEVNFNININGILTVSAIDLSSKKKKEVVISHTGLLTQDEINEVKKQAEEFKMADQNRREISTKKATIFNHIYAIDQFLDNMDVESDIRSECVSVMEKAQNEVENENIDELNKIERQLESINSKLAAMFRSTSASAENREIQALEEETSKIDNKVDTRPLEYKSKIAKKSDLK